MKRACAAAAALIGIIAVALIAAACGSNPNEHVQSNEFFRPASADAQQAAAQADGQQRSAEADQQQSDDAQAVPSQDSSDDQQDAQQREESGPSTDADQADPPDQPDQTVQSNQQDQADGQEDQQEAEPAAPLETTDDVIRRYSNPSYGYSFELICSPFCDPNSNGVDRVSFLSETGRALIGVDVVLDDGSELETIVRASLSLPDSVEFSAQTETATVTGEAAVRFDWDEDRRATGGFQVRWHALAVRAGDVVVLLRAGAVIEDYEGVSPALERALTSFILPLELTARPGRYARFEFVIDYDTADVAQEFGQPSSNPPSEEAGIFVLQTTTALKAVLTWQTLGAAFYDGDAAIQQSLRDSLGIENVAMLGEWGEVDGQTARAAETDTQFGEGVMLIRSFAWYCPGSGREFALHVLDPDDPLLAALPLLESFRCDAAE